MNSSNRPLRVCYFGTYRTNYSRNQIMIKGLRANGVEVIECHEALWTSIADRVKQVQGGWRSIGFIGRVLKTYFKLFLKHQKTPEYDVMMLGYPGPFDAYLGRILSWWRRKPMVIDHYMSLYLIAHERGLTESNPYFTKLMRLVEGGGLRLCNLIITDTQAYLDYHCNTYGLKPEKFRLVPAGVDDTIFRPNPEIKPDDSTFCVAYHGTFLYSHGMETIIEAAKLLKNENIRFDFYGTGPEQSNLERLAANLELRNVVFHGWIEKQLLPSKLAAAHLILGVFGTTQQSLGTIQNKIWEGMAMQRAVITGDSETIRDSLTHGTHIFLVDRANPHALALGIKTLIHLGQKRCNIAKQGFERAQYNTVAASGKALASRLNSILVK